MNLQITGHHVEITPAIRDYVLSKLDRINRHFENVMDVNVTLTVQKLDQKIEANVHLSGKDIHVQCHDADMYAATGRASSTRRSSRNRATPRPASGRPNPSSRRARDASREGVLR
jgi:ribosomal subunit interface protein